MRIDRRKFIRVTGVTAAAGFSTELARRIAGKAPSVHASVSGAGSTEPGGGDGAGGGSSKPYGMLYDSTLCIGCGLCQQACADKNGLPGGMDPDLSDRTYTVVKEVQVQEPDGSNGVRYLRQQCFHCLEPACASACPVGALRKTPEGPVVYEAERCIGCRYCMVACPFGIPRYQWEKALPLVTKCQFCADRVTRGERPACAEACPTGATLFGPRDQLIAEANHRIEANPEGYYSAIYGLTEAGGTSWLVLSDVPFQQLGLRTDVIDQPLPSLTWRVISKVPAIAGGIAALMAIAAYFTLPKETGPQERGKNGEGRNR